VVMDAGVSNTCPAMNVPRNGMCGGFMPGLVCPGPGGVMCTCQAGMGGGMGRRWTCPLPDGGIGPGGGGGG
jgi:hypothetical protein